jgi:hypothetical protein
MDNVWFNDPKELFRSDKILQFWPTPNQDVTTRINATTRFVLYASCIIYIIKRDPRVFVLAGMVLFVIFVLYKKNMVAIPEPRPMVSLDQPYSYGDSCQRPTFDNPMGNVLLSDYIDQPNRPQACDYSSVRGKVKRFLDDTIPYDAGRSRSAMPEFQRNAAARQFVTTSATTIPGDQTGFAEWCYGKKNAPMCRDDPTKCDPNFRGAQLEAFGGLSPSGIPRGV